MKIALDATYSLGANLSGVGIYSRELLHGLAALQPEMEWHWLYRSHRLARALREPVPAAVRRGILLDRAPFRRATLFHGLNQRLPQSRFPLQIATFHDLFVMTADYSTPEFRARFTLQARQAAERADRIIAVSEFTAGQVVDLLHIERSRIHVVPHGVRNLIVPTLVAREAVVLAVGAVQKRKNLVRLVKAFDALPGNWRLVLAGSAGYRADEVFQAISQSKAADRIVVTGYVTAEQLSKWYAIARIFAFPSLEEGFGIPVLEAMSAGVPVLSSIGSALEEVAGNAAYLVDPESVEQIAQGLVDLASDELLREQLIRRGHERSREFTWERSARMTFEVYRDLLSSQTIR